MIDLAHLVRSAAGRMRCFRRDERGSMAIMMGLAAVPIIFSVGAGIDYGTANASARQRSDINKIVTNTSDQCAVACHISEQSQHYYNLAKRLGVTMRIDVLKSATQSLTSNATTIETQPNQYRMAVYTFGRSATSATLINVVALTSNLSGAQTSINNIDLMAVVGQNQNHGQDMNYDSILPSISNAIPGQDRGCRLRRRKCCSSSPTASPTNRIRTVARSGL